MWLTHPRTCTHTKPTLAQCLRSQHFNRTFLKLNLFIQPLTALSLHSVAAGDASHKHKVKRDEQDKDCQETSSFIKENAAARLV